jgi:hypothetical protein
MAQFFAWLMMVLGGLWALLCGACTLFFVAAAATSSGSEAQGYGVIGIVLGLIFTVPGVVVFVVGLLLLRSIRRAQPPPETFT